MDQVLQIFIYFFLSLIFAFSIAPLIISFLYKYKIVRLIDSDFSGIIESRRLKAGTPIMGGLIMVATICFFGFVFIWEGTTKIPLVVFVIIAILGGLDDFLNIYGRERPVRSFRRTLRLILVHKSIIARVKLLLTLPWQAYKRFFFLLGSNPGKGIQAHEKIIIQIFAGLLIAWWLYFKIGWSSIWFPFAGFVDIGVLMPLFIVFVVVALSNAVNITDGMDGLSGGLLLFSFIAFTILATIAGDYSIAKLGAIAAGSVGAYIYFNIPPARVQMGDVGSLSLGALLAAIAFSINLEILIPIICFLFFIEILSVLIQGISRRILGRRIFKMAPLHHHFEIIGWNEEKVVMRFWLAGIMFAILGLFIYLIG